METQSDFHVAELGLVAELFEFRDENVKAFLEKYAGTLPLLRLTYDAIMRFFGPRALRVDLEAGGMWGDRTGSELFVLVQCDLDADSAAAILDDFYRRWWSFAAQLEDWPIHVEAEYYAGV
jgi:hypothetical protein